MNTNESHLSEKWFELYLLCRRTRLSHLLHSFLLVPFRDFVTEFSSRHEHWANHFRSSRLLETWQYVRHVHSENVTRQTLDHDEQDVLKEKKRQKFDIGQ
jgi:hypothetical protein